METNPTGLKLNLGCGTRKLPGFVNIDTNFAADRRLDAREGLPFPDASCDVVFSEHFFERLDAREGLCLLREIRRVLKPRGVLRIATLCLERLLSDYQRNALDETLVQAGHVWKKTRAAQFNLSLAESGRQWIYDEEELRLAAENAGLSFSERCNAGESRHEALRGLERHTDSRLILEWTKPERQLAADARPLVSIVIPAYKPQFFEEALQSALDQTWQPLEIIVTDDCPNDAIEKIVGQYQVQAQASGNLPNPRRIHYERNLGEPGGFDNHLLGFNRANGEFIKFLCDDDVLCPECVERLLDGFRQSPDITLAFSKRTVIDAAGKTQPDIPATLLASAKDERFNGVTLAAAVMTSGCNFIGEPSTVLFRKAELAWRKPPLFSFAGYENEQCVGAGDVAMWLSLLSAGDAAYLAAPLSRFRSHDSQEQQQPIVKQLGPRTWKYLREGAARWGMSGDELKKEAAQVFPQWVAAEKAQTGAAIERLLKLVERGDCDWRVYERLGDYAVDLGDKPLAIAWYEKMEAAAGAPLTGNFKRALLLLDLNRFDEGVAALEGYLARFPDDDKARETQAVFQELRDSAPEASAAIDACCSLFDYWQWQVRRVDPIVETLHRERVASLWKTPPLVEIALCLTPGQEAWLADSIDSLARQAYSGWRLSIFAPGASPEPEFTVEGAPVRWIQCEPKDRFLRLNEHLAKTPATWLGFFDCGTRWYETALLTLGDYQAIRPAWRLIYADDDIAAANGKNHSPRFKPDLNLEYLRSFDYVGGFFIEKNAFLTAGGLVNADISGAPRYDLLLRAIDALGEASIGHIPEVLAHLPVGLPLGADDAGARAALARHFKRRNLPAEIEAGLVAGETRHVRYPSDETPLVSIIVPTKNRLELLKPCIETLLEKTAWPHWELVIADNGSDDAEVLAYYDALRARLSDRVRIVRVPGAFNYSEINNQAARQARGEYYCLLNNDTECIHEDWLDALMNHARRPDVGVVGARLLFPDTLKLQHAGVIPHSTWTVSHVFHGLPYDAPSYMNRAAVDQEYSAVTAACCVVRAAVFWEVQGFDLALTLTLQDIDLCFKIRERGYRVIWTPFATLLHRQNASLKKYAFELQVLQTEIALFRRRWQRVVSGDPAWNRNLSLLHTTPTLDTTFVIPWNPDFKDRPRVLVLPVTSEGFVGYRGGDALRALNRAGCLQYAVQKGMRRAPSSMDLARLAVDTLFVHHGFNDTWMKALFDCAQFNPDILRVYLMDDLATCLPKGNTNEQLKKDPAAIARRLAEGLAVSHRLIVTTEPLAEVFRGLIDDIRVIPNALDYEVWGRLQSRRRAGKKPRVGWIGGTTHAGDLALIVDVVKVTAQAVDWVFMGMIPEELRPHVAEFHQGCAFSAYPEKLASMNLDLAVAPLEIHPFNVTKSNLRLLEYGALGWPVICTDIDPYRNGRPPVTRLPNDPAKWIGAILERVRDLDALAREGDALRDWVKKHHALEGWLDAWKDALLTPAGQSATIDKEKR